MSHPQRLRGAPPATPAGVLAALVAAGTLVVGAAAVPATASAEVGAAPASSATAFTSLVERLSHAPASGTTTVSVPSPSGETVTFVVADAPVMEPGLAARHPRIRTWAGRATGPSAASIRLDLTPAGLHASVRGGGASWYVEPTADGDYRSVPGDAVPAGARDLVEQVVAQPGAGTRARRSSAPSVGEGNGAAVVQRTYRLAFLTDDTYADYVTAGATDPAERDELVTAAKVTLVNRLDQVFGDDLSARLLLVDETDRTSLDTPAEMYAPGGACGPVACFTTTSVENGCDSRLLDRNRLVLGQVVGADDYDIGFLGLGTDAGSAAGLGVAGTASKASGCAGLSTPDGDFFGLDLVGHELGHQLGAHHTFDGSVCGDEATTATAVEPGSGSTIMGRAGMCGSDDLQPHSDPYFSQRSQSEVASFVGTARPGVSEVQNIGLGGFGAGEAFTIRYPGGTPVTVTQGTTYTAAGLTSALESAEPGSATVTVTGFWGGGLSTGFQATWSGTGQVAAPVVEQMAGSFTISVGTTDDGGPALNGGVEQSGTGNRNPVVTAPPDRVIPARTPFELPGSATDPDGDALTYLWEQNDSGSPLGTALNSNLRTQGPLFRVFGTYADVSEAGAVEYDSPGHNGASPSPVRSFPDVAQVAAGSTNAATGVCPTYGGSAAMPAGAVLDCYSEYLPATARTMSFRLTARDLGGYDGGSDGGVGFADTTLTVSPLGPFLVTSQNSATTVSAGATGTVTWTPDLVSLAGNVRITLSTDGGLTYPIVLSASTPNDGSQGVTWPSVSTTTGRIKVAAVDNYFYDLNNADLTITGGTGGGPTIALSGNADGGLFGAASSDPLGTTPTITASATTVDGSALTVTASGLPQGLSLVRQSSSATGVRPATARFDVVGLADVDPGSHRVTLTADDGPGLAPARTTTFDVVVTRDTATVAYTGAVAAVVPAGGEPAQVALSATATDLDLTPGAVIGSIAFTDQTTGATLCTATLTAQAASCAFAPDLAGAAARTYQVVATLASARYNGAAAPTPLVVTGDGSLAVASLPAVVGTQYSDAFNQTFTVSAQGVDGDQLTVSGDVPDGVVLERTGTTPNGVRPAVATFQLSGGEDLAPGSYDVDLTAVDGVHPDLLRSLTIAVAPEDAAVLYTGPTTVAGPAGAGTTTFDLLARVTSASDGTAGDVAGATVAFTDVQSGATLCPAAPVVTQYDSGVGVATCSVTAALTGSGRTYRVRLDAGGWFTGSAAPTVVTVTQPAPPDTTAPDTTITSGPAQDSFVTAASVPMAWSSEPGVTYTCSLVGYVGPIACPAAGSTTWSKLPGGSYEFRVAATDAAGNLDPTPATRRFHVPFDDRLLAKGTGTWKKKTASTAFRGTYQTVAKKGASLTYKVAGATSLALVVEKGPKYGTLDVYLGKKKLKTIKTAAGKVTPMVVTVLAKGTARLSGTLKIVSTSKAQVRVDAVGVVKPLP